MCIRDSDPFDHDDERWWEVDVRRDRRSASVRGSGGLQGQADPGSIPGRAARALSEAARSRAVRRVVLSIAGDARREARPLRTGAEGVQPRRGASRSVALSFLCVWTAVVAAAGGGG